MRGEAFGSAGMVTAGTARATDMTLYDAGGIHVDTARSDTDLLHAAYAGEITGVRRGRARPAARPRCPARPPAPRWPIALAAIESVETGDRR